MASHKLLKGYLQVYTGDNKGKTTAALGLAFRAWGRGMKTYIGQFMKGQYYGELAAAAQTGGAITIEQYGSESFVHVQDPPAPADVALARAGLEKLTAALVGGGYDIVVADEINTCHHFRLLSLDDLRGLIARRPADVELVFTGRRCPPEILALADLVVEMKEVKHYYRAGVSARDGIER